MVVNRVKSYLKSINSYIKSFKTCHEFGSFVFLIVGITLLWNYPPCRLERVSVLKKRSGEEIYSVWGTPIFQLDIDSFEPVTPGYIVQGYDPPGHCNSVPPRPHPSVTVLLQNLRSSCSLVPLIREAVKAKYHTILFYNHSHINLHNLPHLIKYLDPVIPTVSISNEDAIHLRNNYLLHSPIRYVTHFNHGDDSQFFKLRLQPLYKWIPLRILRLDGFGIFVQGLFYVFLIFFIWRMYIYKNFRQIIYGDGNRLRDRNKTTTSTSASMKKKRLLKEREIDSNRSDSKRIVPRIPKIPLHQPINGNTSLFKDEIENPRKEYTATTTKNKESKKCKKVTEWDFEEESVLGYGAYGKVTKVKHLKTGKVYAMKTQNLSITRNIQEAKILAKIVENNCTEVAVPLVYAFVSKYNIHLVMDLMQDTLAECMTKGKLTDYHRRLYTVELGLAIITLHKEFSICHRDLKPSNIMLDFNGHLKIGDFGCSMKLRQDQVCKDGQYVGTPPYIAPEGFRFECYLVSDWWSFGCIVYELFSPQHDRFVGDDWIKRFESMDKEITDKDITTRVTDNISDRYVRHLLSRCLIINPKTRIHHPIDKADLLCIGIPLTISHSVNILKEFPWNEFQKEDSELEKHKEFRKMEALEQQYLEKEEEYRENYEEKSFKHYGFYFARE